MADASVNPRYISQLRPVFVDNVAEVHERAEQKRRCAQEDLLKKKKASESVLVFSFTKDDEPPVFMEFQDRFSYPYFTLTEGVLDHLELGPSTESAKGNKLNHTVHYYNPVHDTWMKRAVDSVILLTKPSQTLFFKATNVTSYPSFDRHFAAAAATPVSHKEVNFRHGPVLSGERRYVRRTRTKMRAGTSQTLDDVLEISSSDEVQDDTLPVLTQKRRFDQSEAPSSQRRRCGGSESESDDDGKYLCQQ